MEPKNNSSLLTYFRKNGKLPFGVIDSHTHMNDVYGTCLSVYTYDETIARCKEQGVKGIWCSPHSDLFDPLSTNIEIREMMKKYPDFVRGFYAFNPNYAEDYGKDIEDVLHIDGYIGFKTLPDYYKTSVGDARYDKMYALASERRLVLLVHTWGYSRYNDVDDMARIADKYPDIQLILGHSSPNRLDDAIALVKRTENVYLDLCDIHRHSGIVEKMTKAAGSGKILFGTDLPWYDPTYAIGSVLCADISDEDRENIFYKNAETILNKIKK